MSKEAVGKFVSAVLQHFPPFRWEEHQEKAWAETMVRELGGFSSEVVEHAAREIVRTRKKPQTPLVAECIDVCLDAKKWLDAKNNAGQLSLTAATADPYLKDWREDDFANEIALNRKNPLCVQAAKDGWIGTLHTFVRKQRRMPSATDKTIYRKSIKAPEQVVSEIEWCKREAKDFDEAYAVAVRGNDDKDRRPAGAMRALVSNVGDAMLKRRNELADCVLRGAKWR